MGRRCSTARSPATRRATTCVQYRETDFNFVSRLMEEEGIYYYFRHAAGKAHAGPRRFDRRARQVPGARASPTCRRPTAGAARAITSIRGGSRKRSSRPRTLMKEYDFKRPRADLRAVGRTRTASKTRHLMGEYFDYPGGYPERDRRRALGGIRLDELGEHYESVETTGTTRGAQRAGRRSSCDRRAAPRSEPRVPGRCARTTSCAATTSASGATDDVELFRARSR